MKMRKKVLAMVLAGVCAANMTSTVCFADEEVTIDFWHHFSAQTEQNEILMNVLIPEFEKENPGTKVNAVSYEWADQHQKMLVSAQSDTLPDVAHLDTAWVPEFEKAGMLLALDEEMKDFETTAETLMENAMDTAKIGDHYYGLALSMNTKMMFSNKLALEKAGVSAPKSIDEFVEVSKKLAGKNENGQQVWGYEDAGLGGWNLCPIIWSMGGELLNEEETQATGYINSEKTVAAIQILADLYKENAITGWNSGDIPMTDGFGTGRYAMIVDGPWKILELQGGYPDFEYDISPVPAGEGGSVSVLGGEDISICNNKNKEASWKFIQFLTDTYAQEEMAKTGQVPANKQSLESETVKNSYYAPFLDALTTAKARPKVACWTEMDGELSVAVTSVMNGEKTAQEAMDELAEKWDAMLAEK